MKYLFILLIIIGVGAYVSAQSPVGAPNLPPQAQVFGGIDVALERVENVGGNQVATRQLGNLIETTFPWKDQPGFKVVYNLGESTPQERAQNKRKKEVITETVDFGDGGYKVDILLNEKPATNVFCYDIQNAEDYDFFYQPELMPEEIADGAERPEDITGSYAVYHKTLKNHKLGEENYATGKVMHIPRPQVWSLSDETTKEWAELSYDNGELCVTAPQSFLDTANYPVRIDPTFGYTSIAATGGTANEIFCSSNGTYNAAPENGTITSITMYVSNAGWTSGEAVRAGVYEGTESDPDSGGFLSETDERTDGGGVGWEEFPGISQAITSGTIYSICGFRSPNTVQYRYDSLTSGGGIDASGSYPTWSALSSDDNIYSLYATYTATAEGEATTTANSAFTGDIIISGDTVLD